VVVDVLVALVLRSLCAEGVILKEGTEGIGDSG
jgi:hypothetical protein